MDGRLLFLRAATLLVQSFDPAKLAVSGDAVAIARNVGFNPTVQRAFFGGSLDSTLVYRVTAPVPPSQLVWLDRSGRELEKIGEPADQIGIELSPDGQRVLLSVLDPVRQTRDLWVQDLARNVRSRFSFTPADEMTGIWSPDGTRILFSSIRSEVLDLFVKAADGSGAEEKVVESGDNKYPTNWSRDGRILLYHTGNARSRTGNDIWVLPMGSPGEQPRVLLGSAFNEQNARVSPDGRWVAYQLNESGRGEIYVMPFPGPGGKWQISTTGGTAPRWGHDGNELFYVANNATMLMRVAVNGRGSAFEVAIPEKLFDARFRNENYRGYGLGTPYDISPDGRRILANLQTVQPVAPDELTVITNWTSLLH